MLFICALRLMLVFEKGGNDLNRSNGIPGTRVSRDVAGVPSLLRRFEPPLSLHDSLGSRRANYRHSRRWLAAGDQKKSSGARAVIQTRMTAFLFFGEGGPNRR